NEAEGRWHQQVVADPASLEEGEDTVHQEGTDKQQGAGECQASEPAFKIRHPAPALRGRDPGLGEVSREHVLRCQLARPRALACLARNASTSASIRERR